jgi:hypothetical protein
VDDDEVTDQLFVLPGDLALSNFEDELSSQWPACPRPGLRMSLS